ncbi:MAG: DUF4834 domain-containing protein [Flavobacteriaceae bacterium]
MIFTADISSFLRTIFIIILFYYLFKFIGKYILPIILKNYIGKVQREQQRRQGGFDPNVNEGETIVDKKPKPNKKSNDSVGEYVDFEEID